MVASDKDMYFFMLKRIYDAGSHGMLIFDLWDEVSKRFVEKDNEFSKDHNDLVLFKVFKPFLNSIKQDIQHHNLDEKTIGGSEKLKNHRVTLNSEWIRHFIEMVELKEARLSSKRASVLAIIAISLNVIFGAASLIITKYDIDVGLYIRLLF